MRMKKPNTIRKSDKEIMIIVEILLKVTTVALVIILMVSLKGITHIRITNILKMDQEIYQ